MIIWYLPSIRCWPAGDDRVTDLGFARRERQTNRSRVLCNAMNPDPRFDDGTLHRAFDPEESYVDLSAVEGRVDS
jgi:hypothetical protein